MVIILAHVSDREHPAFILQDADKGRRRYDPSARRKLPGSFLPREIPELALRSSKQSTSRVQD